MSDINFVTIDADQIINELISQFEKAHKATLYPGDERRIFLYQLAQVLVNNYNAINDTGRQNLLRYARGQALDAMGEFFDCPRLAAQKASVTLRFTLSAAQPTDIIIPAGIRATPDGSLYFATVRAITISAGQSTGDVTVEASIPGKQYNGYAAGQIKNLVDPVPYVASVINTNKSDGGADIETDDDYRKRIRLAPQSYSVAGPEGSYVYWALTADSNIADISVSSPSAGVVRITPLLTGGEIPGQAVLDRVLAVVSAKNRRPLTDNVQVGAPTQVPYNITLTYYISSADQAREAAIRSTIEDAGGAVDKYKAWQCEKLGRAINPDQLRYLMMLAGASRIILDSPVYTEITDEQVTAAGTVNIAYGGLE